MAHTSSDYSSGPVCGSGSQIIYAWAMDAPDLKLPAGNFKYIVHCCLVRCNSNGIALFH